MTPPHEWQVDLAALPVLLTLLGTSCSGCHWENSSPLEKTREKCTVGAACGLWTLSLCFCLFCPCYLDGKYLEMTKYWPAVFSKTKLQNPRVALLYSISHIQSYEFTLRCKNLYLWRDWLAISSWVWRLHLDWWKKSPVYHLKLAHKEKSSSNQPAKATCSLW